MTQHRILSSCFKEKNKQTGRFHSLGLITPYYHFSENQTGSPLRHLHLLNIRQAGSTRWGSRHRIIMCSKSDWQVPLIGQYFSIMGDEERYYWPLNFWFKGRLICGRLLVTCWAKGDDRSDNDDRPGVHTQLRSSVPFIVHARR